MHGLQPIVAQHFVDGNLAFQHRPGPGLDTASRFTPGRASTRACPPAASTVPSPWTFSPNARWVIVCA